MVRFTTKKIATQTLGEKLKSIRLERRLSIVEVSKYTKIQTKYLEYMEDGNYTKLPADVYVKGFLRSWASYMGVNEQALTKQYEREKGIHKNIKKIAQEERVVNPIKFSKLVITPKLVIASFLTVAALAVFFYLYREVESFVSTPRLVVYEPVDNSTFEGQIARVTGIAERGSAVFVNDQAVLTNEKGEFGQDISLQEGLNTIVVKARNKFDKEATKSITLNANFQNVLNDQSGVLAQEDLPTQDTLAVEVWVKSEPVWLSIEADGNLVYSGNLNHDTIQKMEAKEKVSITSSRGNETFIKLNGKDLGPLAETPDAVKDVIFTHEGKQRVQEISETEEDKEPKKRK